jgi:hypothetical protein
MCPNPRNKLAPEVSISADCAKQTIWSKNYTCKLLCDDGRPAVTGMF